MSPSFNRPSFDEDQKQTRRSGSNCRFNESGDLKMPRNIGTIDQVIRAMLGLALIAYVGKDGILTPDTVLALLAGIYLFATGILLRCPLYGALGFTTFGRLDRSA
jgi:Protein of unknown function (DUF2892)